MKKYEFIIKYTRMQNENIIKYIIDKTERVQYNRFINVYYNIDPKDQTNIFGGNLTYVRQTQRDTHRRASDR